MRFPGLCWCGLVLLAACNGPQPTYDPFLGRTTVPPPPAPVQAGPVQPYYPASPMQPGPAPTMQPTTPPPPAGAYSYPQPQQGAMIPPRATQPSPNQYPAGAAAVARRAPVVQVPPGVPVGGAVLVSAPTAAATPAQPPVQPVTLAAEPPVRIAESPAEPRRLERAGDATELNDVPESNGGEAGGTPSAASPPSKFAHAPDYRWLRGQLEYLESKQQWKIRYIPIDGETDQYGGSVVLANTAAVAQFRPGDFVKVDGTIEQVADESESFAPTFHVERIEK